MFEELQGSKSRIGRNMQRLKQMQNRKLRMNSQLNPFEDGKTQDNSKTTPSKNMIILNLKIYKKGEQDRKREREKKKKQALQGTHPAKAQSPHKASMLTWNVLDVGSMAQMMWTQHRLWLRLCPLPPGF